MELRSHLAPSTGRRFTTPVAGRDLLIPLHQRGKRPEPVQQFMNFPGDSDFVIRFVSLSRSLSGKSLADIRLYPIDSCTVELSQNLYSLPRKSGIIPLQLFADQFMGLETYRCRGLAG